MKRTIIHTTLVLRDHFLEDAYLTMENGVITDFGPLTEDVDLNGHEILDAEGLYTGPGLVDIHIHAAGGHWFYEDTAAACKASLQHGTTTVLPTLYFSMTREQLVSGFLKIREAMKTPEGAVIGGFYTEAPYLNPKYGADRNNVPWGGPIRREEYMPVLLAAGSAACVWVVAPEREGILDFILDAKKVQPSVRFAVGHSEAKPQEIEPLIPYGLCIGTHHTNASGHLTKYGGCRSVAVDEVVQYRDDIYAEIISDSLGIHVDPYLQRLIRKIKGDDRIILISDACVFDGAVPESGLYKGVEDLCFDDAGDIAGSKLYLIQACRNFMKHTGATILEVFKHAAMNPAEATGLTDRGEIRPGAKADLILVDKEMNLSHVILNGELRQ